MRYRPFIAVAVLCACRGPGYRAPGDSAPLTAAISDRNLATRVRIVLGEDPETAPYDTIRVTCREGVVVLEGAVDRPSVRRRAAELARGVEGVRRVVTRISLRAGARD